jgi:hypothetical protein
MERTSFLLRRQHSRSRRVVAALPTLSGMMLGFLACTNAGAAEPQTTPPDAAAVAPSKPLDLRAPDVTTLVSAEALAQLMRGTVVEEVPLDEVKVEGPSEVPSDRPIVWPGLLAPFWALTHPTQAWRILAPVPADQVNTKGR